ncbi:acylphosphatase [Dongia sp.]|uniref:acylphosphatase n=1 Tax=Dongia sp. TaxID=1977262 RepID=UPI0035B1CEBA
MAEATAKLCRITGTVQGVWYRAWTVEQAAARGLNGWVRNRLDGSVEALFAGPEDLVIDMIAACSQGPKAARVANVVVEEFAGDVPQGFAQTSDA